MAEEKKDFYETLGLQKGASDDEIKKAYRKKAKECHPDLHANDAGKEREFKQVNEAYEVLSDSGKKERYDQYGHAGVDPSYGGGGGGFSGGGFGDFDVGSIFESFFDGFGGSSSRGRPNGPRKGENIRQSVILSFEEAAFGVEKELNLNRVEKCGTCSGTGAQAGTSAETCNQCKGQGQVRTAIRTPLGMMSQSSTCPHCSGKGKVIKSPCKDCKGSGNRQKKSTYTAKIPSGIDDGQTLSCRGEGHAGTNGGPSGDVLVTVSLRPHPIFVRDGVTVHCEIPVTFAQAALGGEIEVPTLDGKVKINMQEGSQSGTIFPIKGKGIPGLGGRPRGDQHVHIIVEVPKNLNKKQKEILEQFSQACEESNHPKRKGFFDRWK